MSWAIVTDSSCNLRAWKPTAPNTSFYSVPLTIHVGAEEFVDDENLDVAELNRCVASSEEASSSSCPSVGIWAETFRTADNVIAITISENLSGSYEAACTARNIVMDEYTREHAGIVSGKNIYVLNSRATGGKMELIVELLDQYLAEHRNATFDEVVTYIAHLDDCSTVLFSLSSYDNLIKSGRMPRLAGSIASKLNIRMLGTASDEGTIKIIGPTRGEKKMLRKVIECMKADGYNGGLAYIDHVDNERAASDLKEEIETAWPTATVRLLPCGGLCSYYAEESGLIIGFEWA